jgi:ankyrin repeat protein
MDCFAKGVSLTDYSIDGFSPLTHAVREGAIDMVRFFLEHNADINAYDRNGHNAFHVAVMYGYRNICELLIKEDPNIASTLTSKGENAMQLAEKNMFSNWIKSRT